ncbi:MAG: TadA family conjugal transfer-associated ATPase, partial [Phycicoccus sp.]
VPARFEALGVLAGLPRDAVHAQLRGAVRAVVHVVRAGAVRRVDRLGVVRPEPGGSGRVEVVTGAAVVAAGLVPGPGAARLLDLVPEARGCAWLSR